MNIILLVFPPSTNTVTMKDAAENKTEEHEKEIKDTDLQAVSWSNV